MRLAMRLLMAPVRVTLCMHVTSFYIVCWLKQRGGRDSATL